MKINTLLDIALSTDNIDDKFKLAKLFSSLCDEQGIYEAQQFEQSLINQLRFIISNPNLLQKLSSDKRESSVIHIMSTPYFHGGHTRLCERLASIDLSTPDLLVTHFFDSALKTRFASIFRKVNHTPERNPLKKISSIIKLLYPYDKIVMHIHTDDILTTVAIGLLKILNPDIKVYFVNHADHRFSFGKSVVDVMYQISFRGYEVDALLGSKHYRNTFLGIPLNVKQRPLFTRRLQNIVVAGQSYKMKPNKQISLPKILLNYMLKNNEINLTVIGVNYTDYWWWLIRCRLPKRVKFYSKLHYSRYIDVLSSCDTCIDTAPVTGGTAFVEMYINSLRPIGFNCGIYGYTPLDAIRIDKISEWGSVDYEEPSLYTNIIDVHSMESVAGRYNEALKGVMSDIPDCLTAKKNNLSLFIMGVKKPITLDLLKLLLTIKTLSLKEKVRILFSQFNLVGLLTAVPNEIIKRMKSRIENYLSLRGEA